MVKLMAALVAVLAAVIRVALGVVLAMLAAVLGAAVANHGGGLSGGGTPIVNDMMEWMDDIMKTQPSLRLPIYPHARRWMTS